MFRIGEFSKLTQVSIRMLRYYDETGLLKPAVTDSITGYRMYSVEQMPILHRIIFLRDTGFNVSEIAIALHAWNDQSVTLLLEEKRLEIEAAIRKEQEKLVKIDTAIKDIGNAAISVHCNVSLKSIPTYKVVSLRKKVADYFCEGELWQELSRYVVSNRVPIVSPEKSFAIYHDEGHIESDVDIEVCFAVEQMGSPMGKFMFREVEEVDTVVCAMVYGAYENIASAYESVAHWLTQHDQYRMIGMNRQVCHRGPWNEPDSSRYLTEIQIPVIKQSY